MRKIKSKTTKKIGALFLDHFVLFDHLPRYHSSALGSERERCCDTDAVRCSQFYLKMSKTTQCQCTLTLQDDCSLLQKRDIICIVRLHRECLSVLFRYRYIPQTKDKRQINYYKSKKKKKYRKGKPYDKVTLLIDHLHATRPMRVVVFSHPERSIGVFLQQNSDPTLCYIQLVQFIFVIFFSLIRNVSRC